MSFFKKNKIETLSSLSKDYSALGFLLPSIIILLFIGIFPLIYSLYMGFHQYYFTKPSIPFKLIWFSNYWKLLTDLSFWKSLLISFVYTVAGVSLQLIFGLGLALALINEIKGRTIFRTLILIPMVVSPMIVGMIGKYATDDSVGIIGIVLRTLHLPNIVWFANPHLSLFSMIMLDVWQWTPFTFLIILAGLMAVPKDIIESAKIDGAEYFQELRYIILPVIRPIIFLALILRVIDSFKDFDKIWMITRGGPNYTTDVLMVNNFRIAFKDFNTGLASAFSWLVLIIFIIIGNFLVRQIRRENTM